MHKEPIRWESRGLVLPYVSRTVTGGNMYEAQLGELWFVVASHLGNSRLAAAEAYISTNPSGSSVVHKLARGSVELLPTLEEAEFAAMVKADAMARQHAVALCPWSWVAPPPSGAP